MKTSKLFVTASITSLLLANGVPKALAGAADVITSDGKLMKFEYRGDNKMRISMPGQDSYMLHTDGRMYVVSEQNGQLMVIDINQAMGMFGSMADSATPSSVQGELLSFKPAGRTEEVAGITGQVYEVHFVDADGKERRSDMVLSTDKRAKEFRDAMFAMAGTASSAASVSEKPATDLQSRLKSEKLGVLRFGEEMTVTAISDRTIDNSRFVLPAPPTDLSPMQAMMEGMSPGGSKAAGQEDGGSGGALSGLLEAFSKQGERQSEGAKENAEDAVNKETDEAADGTVGKALNKLFGR